MTDHMHLLTEECGDVTVVRFRESWINDFFQILELGQELYQLVEGADGGRLVLDLSNVEYISSAALGKLISLNRRAELHHVSVVLCSLQPTVSDILLASKLDAIFHIEAGLKEALSASKPGVRRSGQEA